MGLFSIPHGEGDEDGLCFGLCEYFDEDADETCPDPGSICAFEVERDLGFCLRGCDPATNTGCFEGQGCVAVRDGGGCIPVGDGEVGDRCRDFEGPFGQCEAGLACVDVGFGPECRRLCNPLREVRGLAPICEPNTAPT